MLVHRLQLFKERKNKVGQTKRKKKFENKSLPLCILESCVCFSSILSTAIFGGFLTCKEFDTAQSVAFGKSLWSVYGHPQVFSEVPSSLCLNLFFPVGHPTLPPLAEHQKLFVLSAEQRPKPLFSKEKPDIVKAGNLFRFIQDICLLTSWFTSFSMQISGYISPHQNTHAAEISKAPDLMWCEVPYWSDSSFPLTTEGDTDNHTSGPSGVLLCLPLEEINLCHIT